MYTNKYAPFNKITTHIIHCFKIAGLLFLATFVFTSCKVIRPSYYFKTMQKDTAIMVNAADQELKITKTDILFITISSLSRAEDEVFNDPMIINNASVGTGTGLISGYQVSPDGSIFLHKLGKVPVEGITRKELKARLEAALTPYLKEPIVTINFSNHFVTVMGEVKIPQVLKMPGEKLALLDALALSGSVNPNSKVTNVLVIRDSSGTKNFKRINLEDKSVIASQWYYLQPNDVVMVDPDEEKYVYETQRSRNLQTLTITLSALSFTIIIIDRLLR